MLADDVKDCSGEVRYTFSVLLEEMLGLSLNYAIDESSSYYEVTLPNGKTLAIAEGYSLDGELVQHEMPKNVSLVKNEFTPENDIPLLYGKNTIQVDENKITCGIDIIATCFFMLTRFEEIIVPDRDKHGRFPATSSLAFKYGFLERPIVDEYVEMLWAMLKHLDPSLKRKETVGKVLVSCDVDEPFDASVVDFKTLVRTAAGDILKRKSVKEAIVRTNRYICNKLGYYKFDHKHTFEWYMDTCEKYGHKVSFYFIADSSEPNNGCYSVFENRIKDLMKNMDKRGHEIGMHGSYQSFENKEKIKNEKKMLELSLQEAGIAQKVRGNRQHYLRWNIENTPEYLNDAGYEYDTTGSYADRPGFRFGTSKEFSMWGWKRRGKLGVKQRPLIVMECSVISEAYLGLGYTDEALDKIKLLKRRAMKFGGNFSILWHNSSFMNEKDKVFFEGILKSV